MNEEGKFREPITSNYGQDASQKKTGICLNMIVKNETAVIERLFQSVAPIIDYFVIVDTGSTDGTPEMVLDLAARHNIPGEIHFREWVNFGHNRQQALEIAVNAAKGQWLLFVDADEEIKLSDPGFFKKLKPGVTYKLSKHHGSIRYALPNLIDISENQWKWRGPAHNYLVHEAGPGLSEHLETVWIHYHAGQGAKSHGVTPKQKYLRDAALFEAELVKNPNDTRSRFYLAQSYREAGEANKAMEHYAIRADMGGWQEEVFYSLYQVAKIKERLEYSDDEVLDAYAIAAASQPKRVEALHSAARFCRFRKLYKKGYEIAKSGLDIYTPVDALFVEPEVYKKGLLDEFSVNAYWAGYYRECLDACSKLLESGTLDFDAATRVSGNADAARKKLANTISEVPVCGYAPKTSQGGTQNMQRGLNHRLKDSLNVIDLRLNLYSNDKPLTGKPLVLWFHHNSDQKAVQWCHDPDLVGRVDRFVFVSYWQMNQYLAVFKLPRERCVVLRNAITLDPVPRKREPSGKLRIA